MACGFRYDNASLFSMPQPGADSSAPFVPLAAVDAAVAPVADPLAAPLLLSTPMEEASQGSALLQAPTCGGFRQQFGPSNIFCVRQTQVLSGSLLGLPTAAGIAVPFTVNGMPDTALTDATGRYSIEAFACEAVMIAAPLVTGFTAAPPQYAFDPVCFSRPDLDFHYTPSGSGTTILA